MPTTNPRFDLAVRALVWLARNEGVIPSTEIADQVHSNATCLRRVMVSLVRAGIVGAREGREGGYILDRAADTVTLADVYRAVSPEEAEDAATPASQCPTSAKVEETLREIAAETETLIIAVLTRYSIADLANSKNIS